MDGLPWEHFTTGMLEHAHGQAWENISLSIQIALTPEQFSRSFSEVILSKVDLESEVGIDKGGCNALILLS